MLQVDVRPGDHLSRLRDPALGELLAQEGHLQKELDDATARGLESGQARTLA